MGSASLRSSTSVKGAILCTLRSDAGMEIRITNLGAAVTHLFVPDASGQTLDVVLGYDRFEDYADNPAYFGCTIGRFANRIAGARFSLEGRECHLLPNEGANSLHGGMGGFSRRLWNLAGISGGAEPSISLTRLSPDGEEGFPGEIKVTVTYKLVNGPGLLIDYKVEAKQNSVVNLTHHGYFNLMGAENGDVLNHRLWVYADRYLRCGPDHLPTGEMVTLDGTPFDFREGRTIGTGVAALQRLDPHGPRFNPCYCIDTIAGLKPVAKLIAPDGRRQMTVLTTEPGLIVYPGSYLGSIAGKDGLIYFDYAGVALETQHWPDAPNRPDFPSTTVLAGQTRTSTTLYDFTPPAAPGQPVAGA
jgi:aldose 1-epimerase